MELQNSDVILVLVVRDSKFHLLLFCCFVFVVVVVVAVVVVGKATFPFKSRGGITHVQASVNLRI